jgi:CubicO group peptidase (beta-lactamase class C family)
MRSLPLLLGAAAACGGPPAPSAPPAPTPAGLDTATLDAWVDRELAALPSAVVALVDRDGLRWQRGVGARDGRDGAAPDPATAIYRIGSITKVLTGTAVLQLRDAGRLDLEDPVARWIPELAARLPGVTIRHLVTHTAGIPSLGDGSAPYWTPTPPSEAALLRALDVPLEFSPGSASAYSNAGMALAGVVIARASGQPYRAYLDEHVLAPLGMRSAAWDRGAVPADRLALGVGPDRSIDPPHWQLGAFEPAGGVYASLADLTGLARLALGQAPAVLAPASLAEALRAGPLPGDHGVAWLVGEAGGLRYATHTGSTTDYSATLVALPEHGLAAIVLAAGPDADLVECAGFALVSAVALERPPPSCAARPLDAATSAAVDDALTRLRALLAAPSEAAIAALFAPAFLAHVPAAAIDEVARAIAERFGRCDRHEITGSGGLGVRAVLHCERGPLAVELGLEDAAPRRIAGLLFPDL